jgi:hypothetical protein
MTLHPIRVLTLAVSLTLCTLNAADQNPEAAKAAAAPSPRPRSASTVDVRFAGGTIAQLIAELKSADGSGFNLMGDPSLFETPVPKTVVSNVEIFNFVSALSSMLRASGMMITLSGGNIFILTKIPDFTTTSPSPIPTFQAYQLAPYLPTVSADDITDAINTAWKADPKHNAATLTFKFHPATKILFVYGPPEAITLATQIIPQLNPNATARAQRDFYTTLPSVTPTDPAAEIARLEAVAQEVRRRRELRDSAAAAAAKALEKK